jgi:Tfp pilus assembly protein PilO
MRKRAALTALGAVVMLVAFWFAAWSPVNHQLSKAHRNLSNAEARQAQLRSQLTVLRAEYKKLPTYEADLLALEEAVPADPSVASIFDQLNSAAVASGVTLPSISPSTTPPGSTPTATTSGSKAGPPPLQISLTADGQYPQILGFLNRLDSSPRLFVINDITLSPSGNGGAMGASLQIDAFYQKGSASQ